MPVVRNLFHIRSQSFFDPNIVSSGALPSICEALNKPDYFCYFDSWFSNSIFPSCSSWIKIVKSKIKVFEENACNAFILEHPSFDFATENLCLDTNFDGFLP